MLLIGWLLIFIGILFIILGTLALFRFPDFYTKLHASSVIECCGVPFSLIGLALLQSTYLSILKLVLIIVIIFLVNPFSTYALARASLFFKLDDNGRIK